VDREERREVTIHQSINLYQDYMGNPEEKALGIFTGNRGCSNNGRKKLNLRIFLSRHRVKTV